MTQKPQTTETKDSQLSASRRVHPEELAVGDYVALKAVSYEYPSFLWCGADPVTLPPDQPVRITFLPHRDNAPLKVTAICLPFILCSTHNSGEKLFDLRKTQFVKLDSDFARAARKALSRQEKKAKKKSGKPKR